MINFIVVSPFNYMESSGGIMALHLLAKELANEGHNVLVTSPNTIEGSLARTSQKYNGSFDPEKTMIIYPEIINGNPIGHMGKYVTRWLLNTPGIIGGDGKYEETDLVYKYIDYFKAPDESKVKGILQIIDARLDIYDNRGESRSGECYIVRKGESKTLNKHSFDSVSIDRYQGHEYLANLFNKKERFISYDSATFHSIQAALCGCISIVIPDEGVTREEYFEKLPFAKYGVAYGMDDIQHAIDTQHLVKEHIENMEREGKKSIKSYIKDCYNHMNIIK